MTEEEAIKWVDDRMCYGRYTPQKHSPFIHDECCQAGEMAIKALEKQIAIPHHHTKVDVIKDCHIRLSICPKCLYGTYTAEHEYPKYCTGCGQKLDWSEVNT